MSKIILTDEGSTPATPSAGTTVVYTQAGVLYTLTSSGTPVAPVSPSIFTATGDMLYASAPGTAARLSIGAAGRFLRVSGGGLPVWSTASAADVGAVALSDYTAAGDLVYGTGAGAVTHRAIGTAGQVLTVNGGATAPVWADAPTTGFVVGPVGSGAKYTTIQSAITAAAAAITGGMDAAVVEVLSGSYTENLTLPLKVSLSATGGLGSVILGGNLIINSLSDNQSVTGMHIMGNVLLDTGAGAASTFVLIENCIIEGQSMTDPALKVQNNGWEVSLANCSLTAMTGSNQPALMLTVGGRITATQCNFAGNAFNSVDGRIENGEFTDCAFNLPWKVTDNTTPNNLSLTNCKFAFAGPQPFAFQFITPLGAATFNLLIAGSFSLAPSVTDLWGTAGATTVNALATGGTFLGTYLFLSLPVLAGNDGALAYSSDENALYILESGSWARVASTANSNTWNASSGRQTFYTTSFKRAAIPEAVNTGTATYTMADDTVAPLIRMDTASGGGAKTVTLFAPVLTDAGKQWVIFDALRNAGSGPEPIDIAVPGGVTINGGAGPYASAISTDGGAIVVRVVGLNAWETIGL